MNRLFNSVFWLSIIISALSAVWFVLHGSIYFHTDIARDFLLIEDIVVNKKITLIGPHSGGIDGVFHGPAWLYLNVPAFVLGGGNPVIVGWFWALLIVLSVGCVYVVTKKLSDVKTAMIAAALFALVIADSAANLFNPFGAVLLSPLYLYFFLHYRQKARSKDLIIALFTIGLIIQFQMAWGVPILLLSLPFLLHTIISKRKLAHLFSFLILLVPLSTYLLFDLRHQFLQAKSVLSYLTHSSTHIQGNPLSFILARVQGMFLNLLNIVSLGNQLLQLTYFLLFITLIYYLKSKKIRSNGYLFYFLYFYGGYWALTLLYKGTMWSYYTTPFTPLFCIAVALVFKHLPKGVVNVLFILILTPILFMNIRNLTVHNSTYFKNNAGLWGSYASQAKTIYEDAGREFGWYVYSADQYGYSPKYAMHFMQKSFPNRRGHSFEKKGTTYLLITRSTNVHTNALDWKKDKIHLTRKPNKVFKFNGGMYGEKYILTPGEQKVPAASDLIQDLIFR